MANLTPQREKFAECVAQGMKYSEAYRIAYPKSENWLDNSVWNKASLLMSDVKVMQRVDELRQPAIDNTTRTLETILNEIDTIKMANIGEDDRIALDCLKHEAKLKGYEIIKTEAKIEDISPAKERVADKVKKLIGG